jgi:hypothetical protein
VMQRRVHRLQILEGVHALRARAAVIHKARRFRGDENYRVR